jgi:hypothetical protein
VREGGNLRYEANGRVLKNEATGRAAGFEGAAEDFESGCEIYATKPKRRCQGIGKNEATGDGLA